MRRLLGVLVGLVVAAVLTGCSPASSSPSPAPAGPPASVSATDATNLVLTKGVRTALVAAGAKAKGLTVSAFKGLERGRTYYAIDRDHHTFWAGAALVPAPHSTAAQISVQDNGSYDVFVRPRGGRWRAYEVGLAGVAGTRCPIQVPRSVLMLWGWPANACRPSLRP